MGLRGPAPRPTRLRILEGNPSKRPLNRAEPKPRVKAPQCPDHLDDLAKAEWKRLVRIIRHMKLLTEADYIALSNLCQAYSRMVKAERKLAEAGLLYKTQSGYVQQSPLLSIINSSVETITKLCREFGLTPSSRSRIQLSSSETSQQDDGILDF
jgi:P27 family predicted phage terminase small subunit